jgi:hypothetical protein
VKCYSGVGDLAQYNVLKSIIAEQIGQSEQVLAHHFDPQRTPEDRVSCRRPNSFTLYTL